MKYTLLLLICITIFSCQKERIPSTDSILELTKEFEPEAQYRTQLRLAFGKIVANAFSSKDFANYILKVSTVSSNNFFDEIVFATHQNDLVSVDKTLYEILRSSIDNEVKSIFGTNFLELVLEDDPLISIKIPDVFYNFKWETNYYSPMVVVQTPSKLLNGNQFFYKGYHVSGFQDEISAVAPPTYFCIVIKYSEDNMLIDIEQRVNEKSIPFFSIVPQAKDNWSHTKQFLKTQGLTVPNVLDDFVYINKRKLNQFYLDLYDSYNYSFQVENQDCHAGCVIDCAQNVDEINSVVDSLYFKTIGTIIVDWDGVIYDDNIELLFTIFQLGELVEKGYFSMGNRRSDFYNLDLKYNFELEEHRYENIGCVFLPKVIIEYDKTSKKSMGIPIKFHYRKGWNENTYHLQMDRLFYKDNIGNLTVSSSIFSPSYHYEHFRTVPPNCVIKNQITERGSVLIKYKM